MNASRRTVVVGEALLPGRSIDDAMRGVTSLAGGARLSIAALDRPDGTTVVAVVVDTVWIDDGALQERLVRDLGAVFATVSVLESDSAALATDDILT